MKFNIGDILLDSHRVNRLLILSFDDDFCTCIFITNRNNNQFFYKMSRVFFDKWFVDAHYFLKCNLLEIQLSPLFNKKKIINSFEKIITSTLNITLNQGNNGFSYKDNFKLSSVNSEFLIEAINEAMVESEFYDKRIVIKI